MYSKSNIYTHRRRNRKKEMISLTIILIISIAAALGIAVYWENVQAENADELSMQAEENIDVPKETPQPQQIEEQKAKEEAAKQEAQKAEEQKKAESAQAEETKPDADAPADAQTKPAETPAEPAPPAEPEPPAEPAAPETATEQKPLCATSERITSSSALVPFTGTKVTDDYFDDVAFVGDSITEGIKLYNLMNNATVVAARGINLDTVFTDNKIRTASGSTTVLNALANAAPNKIYIMFGANGIGWFTEEHFTEVYTKFVQAVKAQHPNSQIFLQSILPVTQGFDDSRDDISNPKIDRYNELIVEIAEKEGVYYLDVASVFKDEKGCLPDDSNGDGMHFGGKYYQKWFDYLRGHTVNK